MNKIKSALQESWEYNTEPYRQMNLFGLLTGGLFFAVMFPLTFTLVFFLALGSND